MKIISLKKIRDKILKFDLFELGNSVILYYFLLFYLVSILVLLGVSGDLANNRPIHYETVFYITIGFIFLIFGYFSRIYSIFFKKQSNFLEKEWDFDKVPWIFACVFILGLLTKAIRILEGGASYLAHNPLFEKSYLYSMVGFFDWFSYIALIIAFGSYFYLKKSNNSRYKIWRFMAWGVFIVEMVYALPSCSRMQVLIPILLYLIVRWYVLEKSYFKTAIILFFSIIILFPFGTICRLPAYNLNNSPTSHPIKAIQSVIEKGQISEQIITDNKLTVVSVARNIGNFAISNILIRTDQSSVFTAILKHPQPFLRGATYREMLFVFGPPRFLWETKPLSINADGNAFGRRIGVLGDKNDTTGVGPTIIGDLYMNFGVGGIIQGMFLLGALFRFIYEYLIKMTGVSLSGVMIYSVIWIQVIKGMEDWIAPVYIGIIRIIVVLVITHFLLVKRNR